MFTRHKHILAIVLTVLAGCVLSLMLTSCSGDEPAPVVSPQEPGDAALVWLSFDISNLTDGSPVMSRADDEIDPGGHPAEAATADENYIDVDDIALLLFDKNNLLIKIVNPGEFWIRHDNMVADYRQYTLVAGIHPDYLAYAQGDEVPMSALLIGNLSGGTFTAPLYSSIEQVSELLNSCTFSPAISGTSEPWRPSITLGRHIPMSGYKSFTINRAALLASTEARPLMLDGTLEMQRALARFRFIEQFDPSLGMTMTRVYIKGSCQRTAYMPRLSVNSDWLNDPCHLEGPSIDTRWFSASVITPTRSTRRVESGYTHYTFEAYATEYSYDTLPTVVFEAADADGNVFEYTVNLSTLGLGHIVRNHIYEFTVEADPKEPKRLKLDYTVCRWVTPADINIDFN